LREKPHFDVINVLPTFVIGKKQLATTKEEISSARGSNALALGPIFGVQNPAGAPSVTVHVDDVAYVHVAALHPNIEGSQNFGVNWNGIKGVNWDDAIDIVRRHFPKEVESGLFPLGGS
jgi:nucleoside-diphosphate-sugar epimerase